MGNKQLNEYYNMIVQNSKVLTYESIREEDVISKYKEYQ